MYYCKLAKVLYVNVSIIQYSVCCVGGWDVTLFENGRSYNCTHLGPAVKVGGVRSLSSPSLSLLEFLPVFETFE